MINVPWSTAAAKHAFAQVPRDGVARRQKVANESLALGVFLLFGLQIAARGLQGVSLLAGHLLLERIDGGVERGGFIFELLRGLIPEVVVVLLAVSQGRRSVAFEAVCLGAEEQVAALLGRFGNVLRCAIGGRQFALF